MPRPNHVAFCTKTNLSNEFVLSIYSFLFTVPNAKRSRHSTKHTVVPPDPVIYLFLRHAPVLASLARWRPTSAAAFDIPPTHDLETVFLRLVAAYDVDPADLSKKPHDLSTTELTKEEYRPNGQTPLQEKWSARARELIDWTIFTVKKNPSLNDASEWWVHYRFEFSAPALVMKTVPSGQWVLERVDQSAMRTFERDIVVIDSGRKRIKNLGSLAWQAHVTDVGFLSTGSDPVARPEFIHARMFSPELEEKPPLRALFAPSLDLLPLRLASARIRDSRLFDLKMSELQSALGFDSSDDRPAKLIASLGYIRSAPTSEALKCVRIYIVGDGKITVTMRVCLVRACRTACSEESEEFVVCTHRFVGAEQKGVLFYTKLSCSMRTIKCFEDKDVDWIEFTF